MTMATYSKTCLSKMSSRSEKKATESKRHLLLTTTKDRMPSESGNLLTINLPQDVGVNICNTLWLYGNAPTNSTHEVLAALGLIRTSEIISIKNNTFRVRRHNYNSRNNHYVELENRNVPQDRNNNTKVLAKSRFRKCTKCNINFKSMSKYNQHREENHPRSKILYCKICSKTFINSDLLLKHKKCHAGDEPYCCLQCDETFVTLQLLTAHIRRHAGKLPYICKICKMGFDLYTDYLNHQPVHLLHKPECSKPKLFKCRSCTKDFYKLCDLERHIRVHTGEKPYTCKICKNRFQQAHNLTKHMIIHTKEKSFKCDICSKEFGRSDVLTRHMITHSVNKPHPCRSCNKSFGRFTQLVDHLRKHHSSCNVNLSN